MRVASAYECHDAKVHLDRIRQTQTRPSFKEQPVSYINNKANVKVDPLDMQRSALV
jgi:hypothetical protein